MRLLAESCWWHWPATCSPIMKLTPGLPPSSIPQMSTSSQHSTQMVLRRVLRASLHLNQKEGNHEIYLGNCGKAASQQIGRSNSNNVDLNRNFPNTDNIGEAKDVLMHKSQPEVSAVIDWVYNNPDNPFVLSANLLDGAMVATYPFDDGTTQIKV